MLGGAFKYYKVLAKVWPCGQSVYLFTWSDLDDVTLETAMFHWGQRWKSYSAISFEEIDHAEYDRLKTVKFA